MIIDLICIAVIVVFIVDLSGFQDTVKRWIWRWLKGNLPYRDFEMRIPFCSLCMTHHICLLYALICGQFSLLIWLFICLLSFFTPQIKGVLRVVSDMMIKAENKIYDILDKND